MPTPPPYAFGRIYTNGLASPHANIIQVPRWPSIQKVILDLHANLAWVLKLPRNESTFHGRPHFPCLYPVLNTNFCTGEMSLSTHYTVRRYLKRYYGVFKIVTAQKSFKMFLFSVYILFSGPVLLCPSAEGQDLMSHNPRLVKKNQI